MLDLSNPPFQHLYIHVPFCRRRCSYCDFAIAVRRQIPSTSFVNGVLRELAMRHEEWSPKGQLTSIYFGGGTPSLLPREELARLFEGIVSIWRQDADQLEITLEVNPDDVDRDSVQHWIDLGINRISLGVQSLQPATLEWMHRTHSVADTLRSLEILNDSTIAAVSVDLIFGLPAAARADPMGDVVRLMDWSDVSHLSVYGLTVESGTPLAKWQARGKKVAAGEDRFTAEFLELRHILLDHGFEHYEVSNYARRGFASLHNQGYWRGASFLGVGPSAHSFAGDMRWWNVRDWAEYDRRMREGLDTVIERERLDSPARWLETVYLGLRTAGGLDEAVARFLPDEILERLVSHGLLQDDGGRVSATAEGWLRLDEIVALLTTSSEGG